VKRVFIRIALTAVCLSLTAAGVQAAEPKTLTEAQAAVQEMGRKYTEQFYLGQLAMLHSKFSSDMKSSMDLETFQKVRSQLEIQLGDEVELYGERVEKKDDYLVYVRRARFEKFPGVIEVRWILNDEDAIAGVFFSPEKKPAGQP